MPFGKWRIQPPKPPNKNLHVRLNLPENTCDKNLHISKRVCQNKCDLLFRKNIRLPYNRHLLRYTAHFTNLLQVRADVDRPRAEE